MAGRYWKPIGDLAEPPDAEEMANMVRVLALKVADDPTVSGISFLKSDGTGIFLCASILADRPDQARH